MREAGIVVGSVAALACAAAIAGSALAAEEPAFDFARSAGLFGDLRGHGLVADLADTTLVAGDTLTLMTRFERPGDGAPGGGALTAVVVERLREIHDLNFDSISGRAIYRLRGVPDGAASGAMGLALATPPDRFSVRDGRLESDLDGDGLVERYSECASHEGLHFAIWEGVAPWSGEPLADVYHYFPFDLEPNCPDMELGDGDDPDEGESSESTPPSPSK
ncbi:MAG TPA: hypothetical protein VFT32_11930 [Candidatus Eisenbacteria bacterium]|nr:hypothetical protein [Candidatus Eisenbacteria bacterium]